jgi:hypothetical protein
VKLGLKNVKAITRINYVAEEPKRLLVPNVDIPATTESNTFQNERLQESFRASEGDLFCEVQSS